MNGVRGWERKKLRTLEDKKRLFRTGQESLSSRVKKKNKAKTNWYMKKGRKVTPGKEDKITKDGPSTSTTRKGYSKKGKPEDDKKGTKEKEDNDLRTAAVLYTENTKGGELAERMRGTLERIEDILGY